MAQNTQELLLAAQQGDVEAFERIYEDFKNKVYAIALSTLKNPQDAEDATQQTFFRVYENLSTLQDTGAFNTWIQRIAINESRMILRKRKEVLSMDDDENGALVEKLEDDFMLPQDYLERDDLSRRLREIIDDLPTAQRQALVLQMYSNMSMAEIAEVMGCSENTVKSRIRYAKATIKTEIEERERKSGEKFYGVVFLPFGTIFGGTIARRTLSPAAAARIWSAVHDHILSVIAAAGTAAGTAAGGTAAAGAAAKVGMAIGAKIAIGAVIGAAIIGGAVFGISRLAGNKDADPEPTEAVSQAAEVTEAPTDAPTEAPTETSSDDFSVIANTYADNPLSPDEYVTINADGTYDISVFRYETGSVEPTDTGRCLYLDEQGDHFYSLTLSSDSGKTRSVHIYPENTSHSKMPEKISKMLDYYADKITAFDARRSGVLYFDDADEKYYLSTPGFDGQPTDDTPDQKELLSSVSGTYAAINGNPEGYKIKDDQLIRYYSLNRPDENGGVASEEKSGNVESIDQDSDSAVRFSAEIESDPINGTIYPEGAPVSALPQKDYDFLSQPMFSYLGIGESTQTLPKTLLIIDNGYYVKVDD